MTGRPVLVADIGGTNARFAMAKPSGGGYSIEHRETFRAEDFEHVSDAAHAFLESWTGDKPNKACFAVAAAISGDEIDFTNSPWRFRLTEIVGQLGVDEFRAINDFEAQARGVTYMSPDDLELIKPGEPDATAPSVVFGPGTGLGCGLSIPYPGGRRIVSTEGGHPAFAPGTEKEIEVLRFVQREYGYVSYERILSGRGLVNIHRALCVVAGLPRVTLTPMEITKAALDGALPIAKEAVDMFCAVLGSYAGGAVLITGARGGAYIAGGIVPKILPILKESDFVERFSNRGPMSHYMEDVPIYVLTTDEAAFMGAASVFAD